MKNFLRVEKFTFLTYPFHDFSPRSFQLLYFEENQKRTFKLLRNTGAKRNAIKYGVFPGWISLYEDPSVTDAIPGLDVMLESGKQVVNRPRVPWYYKFSDALQLELHKAMTRAKSPENALNDAVAETLKIKREAE